MTSHGCFAFVAIALVVNSLTAQPAAADPTPQPSASPPANASPTTSPQAAVPYPCTNINAYATRPSVSTSPCAVRPGQIAVETGYSETTTTGAGANSAANYPQMFVHAGIGPRMEVGFTAPSTQIVNNGIIRASGTSDLGFGLKETLGYSSRGIYGIGLSMTVPTGSAAFTNGSDTYALIVNGSYTLSSQFSLFGTAGFDSLTGTDARGNIVRFGSFIPSVGATYSLPSNWFVYVEGASFGTVAPNAGSRRLVDYGVQKLCGRVQFDASAGNALNVVGGSRFHYVGFGVSALFGKN
jgi:hypothetical protein